MRLSDQQKHSAMWLLPISLLFALPVMLESSGYLPLLLPMLALMMYGMFRQGTDVSLRQVVMLQILLGVLILGMIYGGFQSDPLLNRFAHAGAALVVAVLAASELKLYGSRWLVALAAAAITISLGSAMEIAEAVASIGDQILVSRWHDTILDSSANLAGATLGALAWLRISRIKA